MLPTVLFYSILFLAVVVLPALFILAVLLFVEYGQRFWKRFGGAIVPVANGLWDRQSARRLRNRFPRTIAFLGRRLNPRDAWGLPATLASLAILAGLWFFAGIFQDLIAKDPLVMLDVRLHNSVPLFRSTGMTWFMLTLTEFGSPIVLWIICIGAALRALSRGNRRLAATLLLAIAGTSLLSLILKAAFGHVRPTDALIGAYEASFPSGHLLSGAVVYGLFGSLILGHRARPAVRALATTAILLLIVGIGLSRLYLGVHWPSDLLGSLALALVCLALVLFFLHYDRPLPRIDNITIPVSSGVLQVAGSVFLVAAVATGALLVRMTKIVAVGPPAPARPISLAALLASVPADIPRRSEGLMGEKMEPISIVLIGTKEQVIDAFRRGGWTLADLPTPIRVMEEALAGVQNRPDPSGPATPAYLADRPQTLTFEKADLSAPSARRRHHTRVWQAMYCTMPNCEPVWLATASFDVGVEISPSLHVPTHRIDPEIDTERALIVRDLTAVGAKDLGTITVVPPLRGANAAGDAFTTDGRTVVLRVGG